MSYLDFCNKLQMIKVSGQVSGRARFSVRPSRCQGKQQHLNGHLCDRRAALTWLSATSWCPSSRCRRQHKRTVVELHPDAEL